MKRILAFVLILMTSFVIISCITPDVPLVVSTGTHIEYRTVPPVIYSHPLPPPHFDKYKYVCLPPKRDLLYKPVWQQRPGVKPKHRNDFGNMNRRPIDRPRNLPNQRNKNFDRGR